MQFSVHDVIPIPFSESVAQVGVIMHVEQRNQKQAPSEMQQSINVALSIWLSSNAEIKRVL
jgi:hypothetical protein